MSQTATLPAPMLSSADIAPRHGVLAMLVMLSGTFMVVLDHGRLHARTVVRCQLTPVDEWAQGHARRQGQSGTRFAV